MDYDDVLQSPEPAQAVPDFAVVASNRTNDNLILAFLLPQPIAGGVPWRWLAAALCLTPLLAQPRAILADGSGPWRDAQWAFTTSQFGGLLSDAGYSVKIVAPEDLPSALNSPDILVAVPSLESLPFESFTAITAHVNAGGSLIASGGEPFRNPLYRAPEGRWLDSASYNQAVGSPPSQGPFTSPRIATISPGKEQFITSSGLRVPVARSRGISSISVSSGRYRVIG